MVFIVVLALCYCFLILWFSSLFSFLILVNDIGMSQVRFSNIIMIKLDGFFRMIHRYISLAMSLKKILLGYRLAHFFFQNSYSSTNISVYHAQSIQFYIITGPVWQCLLGGWKWVEMSRTCRSKLSEMSPYYQKWIKNGSEMGSHYQKWVKNWSEMGPNYKNLEAFVIYL